MNDLAELIERQNAVIRIQSEVIDELFILVLQHITAEEADRLPAIEMINIAAKLREKIPGVELYERR